MAAEAPVVPDVSVSPDANTEKQCGVDKLWNPATRRCIKNTPANQRKISRKQGGGKNKTFKQKHSKTKKRK